MKKLALTLYDIGEIMTARMHGATCQVLGERYGRSAEAIRQLIIRYDQGASGRTGRAKKVAGKIRVTLHTDPSPALSDEQATAICSLFRARIPIEVIVREYARLSLPAVVGTDLDGLAARLSGLSHGPLSQMARQERNAGIVKMHLAGFSTRAIAAQYRIGESAIRRVLRSSVVSRRSVSGKLSPSTGKLLYARK